MKRTSRIVETHFILKDLKILRFGLLIIIFVGGTVVVQSNVLSHVRGTPGMKISCIKIEQRQSLDRNVILYDEFPRPQCTIVEEKVLTRPRSRVNVTD